MTPVRALVAVLAIFLAGCASSGATRVTGTHAAITFPPSSPVLPMPSDEPGGRRFSGRFTMTGHFRYVPDTPQRDAVVEFHPDRDIAVRLPYFADLGQVQRIAFDNPSTFLEEVIPAATLTRLAGGELPAYYGRARIVADGYFASVDCDQPSYTVTFVAVESVEATAAASEPAPDADGC